MRRRIIIIFILVIVPIVSYSIWTYVNHLEYLHKTVHETERWIVIRDSKGDILAVETTLNETWNEMRELYVHNEERWIGGIVEEYDNAWGFRFKPETIIIAEYTIEGAQSTIRAISEDLNYWMNIWTNVAYVWAKIIAVYE